MIIILWAFIMSLLHSINIKSSFENSENFLRKSMKSEFPDFIIFLALSIFLSTFNSKCVYRSSLNILTALHANFQLKIGTFCNIIKEKSKCYFFALSPCTSWKWRHKKIETVPALVQWYQDLVGPGRIY